MNHKEMTAHLRSQLKAAGVKAGVRLYVACGAKYIQVNTPAYEVHFNEDEQRSIRSLAVANGLTGPRGLAIDVERMTDPHGTSFVFHGSRY